MDAEVDYAISSEGLERFDQLCPLAQTSVADRLHVDADVPALVTGAHGRRAVCDEVGLHLEFLRPVLEFGVLSPFADYLRWSAEVLAARGVPTDRLGISLSLLGDYFRESLSADDGERLQRALQDGIVVLDSFATDRQQSPHSGPAGEASSEPVEFPGSAELAEFEQALLRGDRRLASAIVDRLLAQGNSMLQIEVHLIQSALYNVGLLWQENRVSVTQEHLATATAQTVMADGFAHFSLPPLKGRRVLLACVEGNEHTVGLRMISDAFELNGWEVQFLGANTPSGELVQQVVDWRPHLVGLSISFPHQLGAARGAIADLRARLDDRCPPVIVGGAAVNRFAPLVRYLGADGHAQDALEVLRFAD
jgi:methanogenic corrinoid protein MtbC1